MNEIHVFKRAVDKNNNALSKENGVNGVWELVQSADSTRQENLESEAPYDEMNAEQTWPTDQELIDGLFQSWDVLINRNPKIKVIFIAEVKRVKKKVPKGTSDYQAAWILDSEEEVI